MTAPARKTLAAKKRLEAIQFICVELYNSFIQSTSMTFRQGLGYLGLPVNTYGYDPDNPFSSQLEGRKRLTTLILSVI